MLWLILILWLKLLLKALSVVNKAGLNAPFATFDAFAALVALARPPLRAASVAAKLS